jgi:hypothetical protein
MNAYDMLDDTQINWLEVMYKLTQKSRPTTTLPHAIFRALLSLGYVTGTPASSVLTADGAGAVVCIRREKEQIKKAAQSSKRRNHV